MQLLTNGSRNGQRLLTYNRLNNPKTYMVELNLILKLYNTPKWS